VSATGAPRADVSVRPMTEADWPAVRTIYAEGIATNDATLEAQPPASWDAWSAGRRPDCRFVALRDGAIVGWVALSPWSSRAVYAGVAWESVYVAETARGTGVGRALLEHVIAASEDSDIWTLIAGVQIENAASLALHERTGFRRIGVQERVGRDPAGRWRDVVLLERRSERTGR
jgi:L-amino acid N-acyltransferase YncA